LLLLPQYGYLDLLFSVLCFIWSQLTPFTSYLLTYLIPPPCTDDQSSWSICWKWSSLMSHHEPDHTSNVAAFAVFDSLSLFLWSQQQLQLTPSNRPSHEPY
jgi:hypothetical protein